MVSVHTILSKYICTVLFDKQALTVSFAIVDGAIEGKKSMVVVSNWLWTMDD